MRHRSEQVLGGLLLLAGVLWLLDTAELVDVWRWGVVAPLLLIVLGSWRIVTSRNSRARDLVRGRVDAATVLGDRHLRAEEAFEGGAIVTVIGDVVLDLRDATLASPSVALSVTAVLGDVDVVVPPEWRVRTEGPTLLSDVEVRTGAHGSAAPTGEDRPPAELVVRIVGLLGDLTVRS